MHADDSFSLQEGGGSFTGKYSVIGATLRLHIVELQKDVDIPVQGENLLVNGAEIWNIDRAPGPGGLGASLAADTSSRQRDYAIAAAGKYVRRGKATDYMMLTEEGKATLQQDGLSLSGAFYVSGDSVTLTLGFGARGRVERGMLRDNAFTDSHGGVWARSAVAPKPLTADQSIDQVIKMTVAKLPDDVIIATIKRSAVKFALTPDQLIRLKSAGVSDDVIRAMTK